MKVNHLQINISEIKNKVGASLEFEFEEKIDKIEYKKETLRFTEPIKVMGRATNLGKKIYLVEGNIRASLEDNCYRCLEITPVLLDLNFSFRFGENIKSSLEEPYLDENGNEIFPIIGENIDLDLLIENEIILNYPTKILCSPDCKGICEKCGKNLNEGDCSCKRGAIDPRLSALEKFYNR
ncbi:MAG: YceD family protein [Thermovenabulum sp.]|uniref:YceD family protein n=1 Tax=Thermovenabulum sp. TaxID=3100335 RepID=UPI003C7D1188